MIVTGTGASATGKSTIAAMILRELVGSRMLISWTTRQARPSDVSGEYGHLTREEFERRRDAGEFEWCAEFDGCMYGTAKDDILEALRADHYRIMILLPYAIKKLYAVAWAHDLGDRIRSFHLLPPAPAVLEARMRSRGDSPASIERRMAAAMRLIEEVNSLAGISMVAVSDSTPEQKFRTILAGLR